MTSGQTTILAIAAILMVIGAGCVAGVGGATFAGGLAVFLLAIFAQGSTR